MRRERLGAAGGGNRHCELRCDPAGRHRAGRRRPGTDSTPSIWARIRSGACRRHANARRRAGALSLPADRSGRALRGCDGNDINKGFDVLWQRWLALTALGPMGRVAGGRRWRWLAPRRLAREAARGAPAGSVRFLGFTPAFGDVLAAGDLLVSPVRYEAYGLNVHEALCRGLAVMVTRSAGVVERFDDSMTAACCPTA